MAFSRSFTKPGRRALTLVELLVTVTVLAVLLVIGLPITGGVRERGQAAECVAALRQIVAAEAAYSVDHQNHLVPYQAWSGATAQQGYKYWSSLLFPYISQRGVGGFQSGAHGNSDWFRCPAQKDRRSDGSIPPGIGPVFTYHKKSHFMRGAPTEENPGGIHSKRRSDVRFPSATASWMDVQGGTNNGYPAYCRGCYPKGGISSPSHGVTDGNNFSNRHFNGANVAFVDGHIEWISFEEIKKVPTLQEPGIWHHHDDL